MNFTRLEHLIIVQIVQCQVRLCKTIIKGQFKSYSNEQKREESQGANPPTINAHSRPSTHIYN